MRRINIVNVFWLGAEPLTDIKEVNIILAKFGVAVATDVLRIFTQWDENFWQVVFADSNWLQTYPQWESWASLLKHVEAEESESPKCRKEIATHSAGIDSLELPAAVASRVRGPRHSQGYKI